jgi:hypothetical protein
MFITNPLKRVFASTSINIISGAKPGKKYLSSMFVISK